MSGALTTPDPSPILEDGQRRVCHDRPGQRAADGQEKRRRQGTPRRRRARASGDRGGPRRPPRGESAPLMGLPWIAWTLLGVLTLVLPALALVQPAVPEPLPPRRAMYLSASTVLWVLAFVTVGVLLWEGVAPHHLRLYGRGSALGTLAWAAGTWAVAVAFAAGVTFAGRGLGFRESVWVTHLMPRDRADRAAFVGVALTAGITEELMYRGFALWALASVLGDRPWLAAALLGVPFGILHAYQGALGVVRAGLLGLVLAVPVLTGGGLVAAVLAHAGVDLALGLGWRRLLHEPAAGEGGEPEEGAEPDDVGDRGEHDRGGLGGV